ncbi:T9SS type A sorting domain-containing protein [Hymenobacter sp. ASUV-10]|uniref:T9SS type A sorting domain-containing protein n=1 Tax=Hymenobacter aranciens TaxID=3063996 RepID=A0ABT9B7X0_9BACT|nr:T9SS type A sorting domain-containing protein [Hymenobacter sp. ASUV-10]MDO7873102.1 T9SS type A sorting domain-containing protein [Hymenobacter sp. ASUV-10]
MSKQRSTPSRQSNWLGFFLLLLLPLLAGRAMAQQQAPPPWQAAFAIGSSPNSYVTAVATDSVGNMYLAGYFSGTARFGSLTLNTSGNSDGFIVKWSPSTNTFVWAQRWGGANQDEVSAIAVRGPNVYLTGTANGFGVQVGTLPVVNCSQSDIIVIKLVDAGTSSSFAWAYRAGSGSGDYGYSIIATADAVYVAGFSSNGHVYFNPLNIFFNNSFYGTAIIKLVDEGSSARVVWLQQVSGNRSASIYSMAAAPGGILYVAGSTTSTSLVFGTQTLTKPGGPDDSYGFVAKLVDQGTSSQWVWGQGAGGSNGNTYLRSVCTAGNAVYTAGAFTNSTIGVGGLTLTNTPGAVPSQQQDIFLTKLTDTGGSAAVTWVLPIGGSGQDSSGELLVDGSTLYLSGDFNNTVSFGSQTYTSAGRSDVFISRLTDTGSGAAFVWTQQGGGSGGDGVYTMARHDSTLYVGGLFAGFQGNSARFGPFVLTSPIASTATRTFGFAGILGTNGRSLPTAVRSTTASAALELYPNPAQQTATLTLPAALAAHGAEVVLLNGLGQEVRRGAVAPQARQTTLSLAQLSAGIYTVQVQAGAQVLTKRLTVL